MVRRLRASLQYTVFVLGLITTAPTGLFDDLYFLQIWTMVEYCFIISPLVFTLIDNLFGPLVCYSFSKGWIYRPTSSCISFLSWYADLSLSRSYRRGRPLQSASSCVTIRWSWYKIAVAPTNFVSILYYILMIFPLSIDPTCCGSLLLWFYNSSQQDWYC